MGNKLSHADLDDGADAVEARLRAGASPNQRFRFPDALGPLPANCPCTPLGYAILASDLPLLDTLLSAGANPRKPVGLPHGCNLPPLHLAAAVGNGQAVERLVAAGADPGAGLDILKGFTDPITWLFDLVMRTPLPPVLEAVETNLLSMGDTPLHIAADVGAHGAIEALLSVDSPSARRYDVNALNEHNESPLYRACSASQNVREMGSARLLIWDPRVDVNAGGALFGAIQTQDASLVRSLLRAGARVDRRMRNAAGQSPLAFCLYRDSYFFGNRADLIRMLLAAGAVLEPGMIAYAEQQGWGRVRRALESGLRKAKRRGQVLEGEKGAVAPSGEGEAGAGPGSKGKGVEEGGKLITWRWARPAQRLRTGPDNVFMDAVYTLIWLPVFIPIGAGMVALMGFGVGTDGAVVFVFVWILIWLFMVVGVHRR